MNDVYIYIYIYISILKKKGSRFTIKPDKILITLRKVKKEDNWFSLVKVRTIGSVDSDWKYFKINIIIIFILSFKKNLKRN